MHALEFKTEDRRQCPACLSETMEISHAWESVTDPGSMFIKWECRSRTKSRNSLETFLCPGKKFEKVPIAGIDLCPVPIPKPLIGKVERVGDCPRCGDPRQALHSWGDKGQICLRCTAELIQLGYDPEKAPIKYNSQPVLKCELCGEMVKILHLMAGGLICDSCNEVCDMSREMRK